VCVHVCAQAYNCASLSLSACLGPRCCTWVMAWAVGAPEGPKGHRPLILFGAAPPMQYRICLWPVPLVLLASRTWRSVTRLLPDTMSPAACSALACERAGGLAWLLCPLYTCHSAACVWRLLPWCTGQAYSFLGACNTCVQPPHNAVWAMHAAVAACAQRVQGACAAGAAHSSAAACTPQNMRARQTTMRAGRVRVQPAAAARKAGRHQPPHPGVGQGEHHVCGRPQGWRHPQLHAPHC